MTYEQVKALSPEAKRIALAGLGRWQHRLATHDDPVERGGMRLPNLFGEAREAWWHDTLPNATGVYFGPSDYLNDLNAVREIELCQHEQLVANWQEYIDAVTFFAGTDGWPIMTMRDQFRILNMTAPERCDALLATLLP